MPNSYFTQQALANDGRFRLRLRGALATVANVVLNENVNITGHAARAAYARQVVGAIDQYVNALAPSLVMRTNLFVGVTTAYDFNQGAVVTDASDAAIESQITTDWNNLAGA